MNTFFYLTACCVVAVLMGLSIYGAEHIEINWPEHEEPFLYVCRLAAFEYSVETALTASPGQTETLPDKLDRLSRDQGYRHWIDLSTAMEVENYSLAWEQQEMLLDLEFELGSEYSR
jgi:hypothetical protein